MPTTYEVYGPKCEICGEQCPDLPGLDPQRPWCSLPCENAWRLERGLGERLSLAEAGVK